MASRNLENDEEFARRLQQEINQELNSEEENNAPSSSQSQNVSAPSSSRNNNSRNSAPSATYTGATFAQLPEEDNYPSVVQLDDERNNRRGSSPPVFEYQFDDLVSPSPEYTFNIELARQAFMLKFLIAIDLLFAITWLAVNQWILVGGIFFAPIGFWGVFKYNRRIVLVYLGWLPVSMLVEFVMMWVVFSQTWIASVLLFLLLGIHAFTAYFVFQFFKILPREPLANPEVSLRNSDREMEQV